MKGSIPRRAFLLSAGLAAGAIAVSADFFSPESSAFAAGSYLRPCGDVRISDSWRGHKNRNPPSPEPGTDYAVLRGTPVQAAADGMIVDRNDSPAAATGRYLALRGDDGNYIRYLHLNSSAVFPGRRVRQGDVIAYSGASGFGSDTYYGPHVHVSLWIGRTPQEAGFRNTADFENYVAPEAEAEKKDIVMRTIYNINGVDSDDVDKRRRAIVGEFTFQTLSTGAATREFKLWGSPENVTQGEWDGYKILVNSRRISAGMPTIP